jgi:hypothetical protein
MGFDVAIYGQRGFTYFSFFGFDVLVKLLINILLGFFLCRFLFGNSNNTLIEGT